MNTACRLAAWCFLGVAAGQALAASNLIVNGSFDAPGDPLQGWSADYTHEGISHYMQNAARVAVVPSEGGRSQVLHLDGSTEPGTKVESSLIPFDPKGRYRATLFVKGGPYRIQFRGYQWRPGVRPHPDPKPEALRQVYRGKEDVGQPASGHLVKRTGAVTGANAPWKRVTVELPGTAASDLSLKSLSKVRFIRLYVYTWNPDAGKNERSVLFIDEAVVERID